MNINIIHEFNQLLFNIYNENNITCLTDDTSCYNVVSSRKNFNLLLDSCEEYYHERFKKFKNDFVISKYLGFAESELREVTQEIKYRVGSTFLYKDLITYFNAELQQYDPNIYDNRFNYESSAAIENIYKFWQRASDLLLIFFPEHLLVNKGNRKVPINSFFHTPLDIIRDNYPHLTESKNYKWLDTIGRDSHSIVNLKRKKIVHYFGFASDMFDVFLSSLNDKEKIAVLNEEKKNLPFFLKEQLCICCKAYFYYINFINELIIENDMDSERLNYRLKHLLTFDIFD